MLHTSSRVCIVHDAFVYRGGAERLVLMMARALNADIVTGFVNDGTYDMRSEMGFVGKCATLVSPNIRGPLRHLVLHFAFRFRMRTLLRGYDTVIFSGDCLGAVHSVPTGVRTIFYCHTPPRYLFDQRALYLGKVRPFVRIVFSFAFTIFAWLYRRDLARIAHIVTNSQNTQSRIRAFLGRESEIVYPAVDTSRFTPSATRGDYYLSFARLATIKRVDRIVEAFARMPDRYLVLVHGSYDPQKDYILALASTYSNIRIVESPSDDSLHRLIAEAIATIYIPRDEDFGMSPIESMACGVPVIGVNEGGLRESIIDGETGILISSEMIVDSIIEAVRSLPLVRSLTMYEACMARARDFSLATFEQRIGEMTRR